MTVLRASARILASGTGVAAAALIATALLHPPLETTPRPAGPDEWVGVVHVHTDASHDGGGTLDQALEAALEADLDFLLLTDHDVRGAPGWSWRDSLLLVVGEEVSTPYGHLVTLGRTPVGSRRTAFPRPEGPYRIAPAELENAPVLPVSVEPWEGLRIAAHPTGRTRWKAWSPGHFDGIEIWNADSERRGDTAGDWLHALALLPLRPQAALFRLLDHPTVELALFDALLARDASVFGVCSVDAHHTLPLRRDGSLDLHFPAYRHSFRMARQHVLVPEEAGSEVGVAGASGLAAGRATDPVGPSGSANRSPRPAGAPAAATGDPDVDGARLLAALRDGRSYCAFDGLADARGARFEVEAGGARAGLGERVAWAPGARLHVEVPPTRAAVTLTLVRDGAVVGSVGERTWEVELPGPGIYRVEAALRRGRRTVPWILTNPIRVEAPDPDGGGVTVP